MGKECGEDLFCSRFASSSWQEFQLFNNNKRDMGQMGYIEKTRERHVEGER
ncbi:hypothetical protein Bca4012_079702 [Brassica carinata]